MSETITITEAETGPEAPQAEASQDNQPSERPEWLPEKFNTPEDLAKSYSELEKKLSSPTEETQEDQAPAEEIPQVEFNKFAEEFSEKGELSTDSFSELEKMGYPKEMVETYIKGMQASEAADSDAVMQVAGGADGYQELTDWARDNMEARELELYNQMVGTGTDNAKMAVEWLMSKREVAGGIEPNLLSGRATGAPKQEYRSTAEVVRDMQDPRYKTDSAFRQDVENKLARSSVI
mgnify:FL=1|tara:strand:- start:1370 stop:2077 length:708 start_codon:yes stop_codon:yes gene_type:complete